MAAILYELLKLGFVICEVALQKKKPPAAAISTTGGAVEILTLRIETLFRP
jgi:hypothetical protein